MAQLNLYVPIGLVVLGFLSLFLGICFLAWGAAQKSARAGTRAGGGFWPELIRALSKLVDSLAKYFPNGAAKIGAFLVLLGIFLIGAGYYVSDLT
jgi:uncharacterized membrane protein